MLKFLPFLVDLIIKPDKPTPSLHLYYRDFNATPRIVTGKSVIISLHQRFSGLRFLYLGYTSLQIYLDHLNHAHGLNVRFRAYTAGQY